MKNKVMISIAVAVLILLCLGPVIGITYGLFEETVSTRNHLVSGSLDATLVRKRLVSLNADADGYLKSVVDDNLKDFSHDTGDNIFGVDETMLVVPGSSFTAEMRITNNGNVAFYYYVEVFFNSTISDASFASMLKLSVVSEKGIKREILIKDGLTLGKDDSGIGLVPVGASENFTVKLEFLDDENNNNAQNKFVVFDLRVHLVQQINAV